MAPYAFYPKGASAALSQNPSTLILYDAASGIIPSTASMGFLALPQDAALLTFDNDATVLDTTTAGNSTYAGWVTTGAGLPGFPILDRAAGFQVNLTLQVENESHSGSNRAGFSIIVLSQDARGIELAFWEDQIWAQADDVTGGLFSHGEGTGFDTTSSLVEYLLTITGDTYTLTANHEPILSGPVRDYSAFDGFPDPYETPSFLFLGDDTTSAQARIRLGFLSVTGPEPVVPTAESTSPTTTTPLPTASSTPLPSATPSPSPAPSGTPFRPCPSGWILLAMALSMVWMGRRNR